MPAIQDQLIFVRIVGHSDQQSVQTPLWYRTPSPAGISLVSVVASLANVVKNRFLPFASTSYRCIGIYAATLAALEVVWTGPDNAKVFKTVRKRWGEKIFFDINQTGAITSPPMPSYVAATAEKVIRATWFVNPTTGVVQSAPGYRGKNGSIRIGGLVEADTETTECNLLRQLTIDRLNQFTKLLGAFLIDDVEEGVVNADLGKQVSMGVLHEHENSAFRLTKNGSTDPADWAANFAFSDIQNDPKVAIEVGSQVSRKRKRLKYA